MNPTTNKPVPKELKQSHYDKMLIQIQMKTILSFQCKENSYNVRE
jgi:hypothetical protein